MALSAQAALLDELMGKNRNAAPGEAVRDCHFTDPDVCKHFLCGFCPHELFVNTRADLGPCDKIHDDNLKKQYEKSSRKGRLGYEEDFEQLLRSLLADVEKRIKKGRDRLSLTQGSDDKYSSARQERINALNEQINTLISEADQLGREGSVDAAKEALEKCERLKIERLDLETRHTGENAKAMEVCNVCGSFLIVGDAQCRVEEHITGKQHVGFAKIRSTIEQLRVNRQKAMEERMKARELEKSRHLAEQSSKSVEKRSSRHRSGSRSSRHRKRDDHYHSGEKDSPRHAESRHRSSKTSGNGSRRTSPHSEHRVRNQEGAREEENHHSSKSSLVSKTNENERRRKSRSASNRRKKEQSKAMQSSDSSRDRSSQRVRSHRSSDRATRNSSKKKRHSQEDDDKVSRSRRRRSRSDDTEDVGKSSRKRSSHSRHKESSKHRRKRSPPEKKKHSSRYGRKSGSPRSSSSSESDSSSSHRHHRRGRKAHRSTSTSSCTSVDKSE